MTEKERQYQNLYNRLTRLGYSENITDIALMAFELGYNCGVFEEKIEGIVREYRERNETVDGSL